MAATSLAGFQSGIKAKVAGNIDLFNRPVARNKDGSISTVRSISIGTDQGEVLIPTVSPDGRVLSDDDAIAMYEKTGRHLGIFGTPQEATAYANELHKQQENLYTQRPKSGVSSSFNPVAGLSKAGLRPTSGFRTQKHQEALIAQGLTNTRNSAHTRGDAIDFAVPPGMSKAAAIELVKRQYPGAKVIKSNGNAIHATFPGWGGAPDVSNSRGRYK